MVGTGDYDANRSADILWERAEEGELTLWRLQDGVLVESIVVAHGLPADEDWRVGGSADFDGNGADDVLLFSRVAGLAEVWSFDGATLTPTASLDGRVGAWTVSATEDTDGDGSAEIVWLDEHHRGLELQSPTRGGTVSLGDLSAGWRGRGGADVDSDGVGELVMHHANSGTLQSWRISSSGVAGAEALPGAPAGVFAGSGDFDGDGAEDLAWSDESTGAVTLMLDVVGAPLVATVDSALPNGGSVVSGAEGTDESDFYGRFCSGDFDADGDVDQSDFQAFKRCFRKKAEPATCDDMDMNSDGVISVADFEIFKLRFRGQACDVD